MAKSDFLRVGEDVNGFEIVSLRNAPDGITSQILWDLWDITVKFGKLIEGHAIKLKCLQPELVMELSIHKVGNIMVVRYGKPYLKKGGTFLFSLDNEVRVVWDRGLLVPQAAEMITAVDEIAKLIGMKVDGSRILLLEHKDIYRMSVEEVFSKERNIMVVDSGNDAEKVLSAFDHPEKLAIVDFGLVKVICLKSDEEKITSGVIENLNSSMLDEEEIPGKKRALEWRLGKRQN